MKVWAIHVPTLQTSGRRACVLAMGLALGALTSTAAWAQILDNGPIGSSGHSPARATTAAPDKPAIPPPDAVPGSKAREPAAPATRPVGDMQPTDALFDAINRGDIAGARDALNRGADLNGVNVLGMPPMELSVDLGRNAISFLLLSMRGEDSGRGARAVGRDTAAAPPPPNNGKGRAARQTVAAKRGPVASTPVATKPIQTPKLFANDGGTPVPSAGFLGFGSRSETN